MLQVSPTCVSLSLGRRADRAADASSKAFPNRPTSCCDASKRLRTDPSSACVLTNCQQAGGGEREREIGGEGVAGAPELPRTHSNARLPFSIYARLLGYLFFCGRFLDLRGVSSSCRRNVACNVQKTAFALFTSFSNHHVQNRSSAHPRLGPIRTNTPAPCECTAPLEYLSHAEGLSNERERYTLKTTGTKLLLGNNPPP